MFERAEREGIPFVIAEVGQNHQGKLDLARQFVRVFAEEGADAIKFQTRDNKYLFSRDAYESEYHGDNAFGPTYGEHREALELRPEWLATLKKDCHESGVLFMSTPFDEPSLELLTDVGVDAIKIASFDLGNLPFVHEVARTKLPVVASTGGGTELHVKGTVDALISEGSEVALLHCVSEYPCDYDRLGLSRIADLRREYPLCAIGSSDHFNGILSGPVAYLQGARVFEKHVTINRSWKGTDQSFSLEREGFRRFVRDLHRVRHMLPPKDAFELGSEPVFKKLGKSLVARNTIAKGSRIELGDLSGKIFKAIHVPVRESGRVIGRIALRDFSQGEPLQLEDFA